MRVANSLRAIMQRQTCYYCIALNFNFWRNWQITFLSPNITPSKSCTMIHIVPISPKFNLPKPLKRLIHQSLAPSNFSTIRYLFDHVLSSLGSLVDSTCDKHCTSKSGCCYLTLMATNVNIKFYSSPTIV